MRSGTTWKKDIKHGHITLQPFVIHLESTQSETGEFFVQKYEHNVLMTEVLQRQVQHFLIISELSWQMDRADSAKTSSGAE